MSEILYESDLNEYCDHEPTHQDLRDYRAAQQDVLDADPFVRLRKDGPFWEPVYVFVRRSGEEVRVSGKEYAELVRREREKMDRERGRI